MRPFRRNGTGRYAAGVLLPTILLYLTLAACAVVIGVVVVRYDLYEREPWFMVLLAVSLGAACMYGAGEAQAGLIRAVNGAGVLVSNGMLALMAGVTEEVGKLAAVLAVAWSVRRYFNEPLDGLMYGSFAGLGAALEESVWVLGRLETLQSLPPQEPVRLAGHLIMGGIGGFGAGLLTTRPRAALWAIPASLAGAIALHSAWDVVAFDAADHFRLTGRLEPWHTGLPVVLMILGLVAYRRMVTVGTRWTAAMCAGQVAGAGPPGFCERGPTISA